MSGPALSLENVRRTFGRKTALEGVTLTVEPGTVLGLVGRNGAGKTTTLRLACGLLFPDSGAVRVFGLDPSTRGLAVRARASLLSEETSLHPWMTVEEILRFAGRLHPRWDAGLAESFRKRLGLDPGDRIRTLSRGTRAKVALVLAAACRPDLLLLDDPTAGLDPLVRREVLGGVLEALPAEGGAVVYASHLIHEVERVADRVAVLDRGRIRVEGALDDLKARVRRARAVFDAPAPPGARVPGQIDAVADGRVLTVVGKARDGDLERSLLQLGARQVVIEPLSLEEILVAYLRQGDGSGVGDA